MSKQPLWEPSGEFKSFHLGLGHRFVLPRLGAKSGRDFSRNTHQPEKNWSKTAEGTGLEERKGGKKRHIRAATCGCEMRRARLREGKGLARGGPCTPRARTETDSCPSQPEGRPLRATGPRAALGVGFRAGSRQHVTLQQRAVTFSVGLAHGGRLPPPHCTSHAWAVSPVRPLGERGQRTSVARPAAGLAPVQTGSAPVL